MTCKEASAQLSSVRAEKQSKPCAVFLHVSHKGVNQGVVQQGFVRSCAHVLQQDVISICCIRRWLSSFLCLQLLHHAFQLQCSTHCRSPHAVSHSGGNLHQICVTRLQLLHRAVVVRMHATACRGCTAVSLILQSKTNSRLRQSKPDHNTEYR